MQTEHSSFHDFEFLIRQTVHYLYVNRVWKTLDDLLLALHDNNGLRLLLDDDYFLMKLCVDANVTETFIGILVELCASEGEMEYFVCHCLAKSVYFWFVENEREEAIEKIAVLSRRCLLDPDTLNVLIGFIGRPMFYFIGNDSKKEYLEQIFMEYRYQFDEQNVPRIE